jgi:hypothetical protein
VAFPFSFHQRAKIGLSQNLVALNSSIGRNNHIFSFFCVMVALVKNQLIMKKGCSSTLLPFGSIC